MNTSRIIIIITAGLLTAIFHAARQNSRTP
jgi:hypothetical protein